VPDAVKVEAAKVLIETVYPSSHGGAAAEERILKAADAGVTYAGPTGATGVTGAGGATGPTGAIGFTGPDGP
jgi:hypothetical protein